MVPVLMALSLAISPMSIFAGDDDKTARIEELEKQIAELQSELAELKGDGELTQTGKFFQMSVARAYTATELPSYGDNEYPEEGNVYLIIDMDAKNISNEDLYLNRFYFTSFVDGYSINDSDGFFEDIDVMTGDIFAGKSMSGSMVYEVPAEWKEFEINYTENKGDKLTFVITPESPVLLN